MSIGSAIGSSIGRAIGSAIAGGASWSPLALFAAGEKGVWFDPSDFSSMFQDSAGTTPVTAVGQAVGRINDKSGNAKHATQASPGSRPLLQQDGSGFYYLDFDGVDDSLATAAIDFSATDKMTVCAGVRKLSTVVAGMLCELSASSSTNNGTFWVFDGTAGAAAGDQMSFRSRGTTAVATATAVLSAPRTLIVTGIGDISGDLCVTRADGVAGTPSSVDQGTGNFGNYAFYIGRRGGTSLPFNGRIYQLVVRGAVTASLTDLETYVNSKTGAY